MEKENSTALSEESIVSRIDAIKQAVRNNPEEIERIKGIIRKNVSLFSRLDITAYLLMEAASGKGAREGRRDTVADGGRPSHGRLGDGAFRLRDAGRARNISEGDAPGTQDKLGRGAGIRDRRNDEGSRR